jgi:hypothetical protein
MPEYDPNEPMKFDLEPAQLCEVPRYADPAGTPRYGEREAPIPAVPLHLCPSCNYNLTGLTSRRCPECGTPFTLRDAKMHGIEMSDDVQRHLRFERWRNLKSYLGVGLLLLAVWLPNVSTGSLRGLLGLKLTGRGYYMLSLLPVLLLFACYYKIVRGYTWEEAIWMAGLIAISISAVLVIL